jgi:large subunit ribosomal protein L18
VRALERREARRRRHLRVRRRVRGTPERPRIVVFRSNRHIYAQLVDDVAGRTLAAASSLERELRAADGTPRELARRVGEALGRRARERGIEAAVFDRGGYKYHGRVAAVAEGARAAGLRF